MCVFGAVFSCFAWHLTSTLQNTVTQRDAANARASGQRSSTVFNEAAVSAPRLALVDVNTNERLGGGAFATLSKHLYEQKEGYQRSSAAAVRTMTRDLTNSYFHLERQGFAAAGFDWIMIDPRLAEKAFASITQQYRLLLITPAVMLSLPACMHTFESEVVVYMDEPPDTTSFIHLRDKKNSTLIRSVLDEAEQRGLCSKCTVSHFFTAEEDVNLHKYFPPIYDGNIFDRIYAAKEVCSDSAACAYIFVQKRCAYADEISGRLAAKGYKRLHGESWGHHTYSQYFANMIRARWVIALDRSMSAGQVIAEASLLGIPTIAFAGKPNAKLLLPNDLTVAQNSSDEETIEFVLRVIASYDSERDSYRKLSTLMRERAKERLTFANTDNLVQQMSTCCAKRL